MNNKMSFKIEITSDLREQLKKATAEQIELALKNVGSEMERNASDHCPVDTGFLRNSITYALDGQAPEKTNYKADDADKSGIIRTGSYSGIAPKENGDKRSVICGSNLPYARRIEFDGWSSVKAPEGFLRIGITENLDTYRKLLSSVLSQLDNK